MEEWKTFEFGLEVGNLKLKKCSRFLTFSLFLSKYLGVEEWDEIWAIGGKLKSIYRPKNRVNNGENVVEV